MVPLEQILPDVNSSFKVLTLETMAKQHTWDYHFHPETEIVFVPSGNGRRHVGAHISYFTNGDLVLIGSNLPHAGFGYGANGLHKAIVVQFNTSILSSLLANEEFGKIKTLLHRSQLGIVFSEKVKSLLEPKFHQLAHSLGIDRFLILIEILAILAEDIESKILNQGENQSFKLSEQERLKTIFDLVEVQFYKNLTSVEIAQHCHMTHPAFCNYFKKQMGLNFTAYLTKFRLKKACEMLAQNSNVSEVAFATGFESLAYFSRVFKQTKGISPSEYRKTLKGV